MVQKYSEAVSPVREKHELPVIAKHTVKLVQTFDRYYAHTRILADDEQKEACLALVCAAAVLLREDLCLLGLHALDKM